MATIKQQAMFGKNEKKPTGDLTVKKSHAFRTLTENPENDSRIIRQIATNFRRINTFLRLMALCLLLAISLLTFHLFFFKDKEIIAFLDGTLAGCVMPAHEMQSR